jgi:NitT/TauT family transport system substrate-binding protein
MRVIAETIDWCYEGGTNPECMKMYAELAKVSVPVATRSVKDFYPESSLQLTEVKGLQKTLDEALQYKRITEKKTEKDAVGMIDIVYKPGK